MRILLHIFLCVIVELLQGGLCQELNVTDVARPQDHVKSEVDSIVPEVTTVTPPKSNDTNGNSSESNHDELMDWINSISLSQGGDIPDVKEPAATTVDEGNNVEMTTVETIEDPDSFFKWLDSIHPKHPESSSTFSPPRDPISVSTVDPQSNALPENVLQEDIKMLQTFGKEQLDQLSPTESSDAIFAPGEHIVSEVDSFFNWLDSIKVAKTTPKPSEDILELFNGLFSKTELTSTPDASARNTNNLYQEIESTLTEQVSSTQMTEMGMKEFMSVSPGESVDKFTEANTAAINGEKGNKERKPVVKEIEIISTRKLLIVAGTVAGTLLVFVLVISITLCYRRQGNAKRVPDDTESYDTVEHEKHVPTVNVITADDYPNMFMGIPTNNGIWKELQNLPETSPSVMSESTKI